MEIIKASVQSTEDKWHIAIDFTDAIVQIPISDDNPLAIKSAFNRLIERLKCAEFQVELTQVGSDLFNQVANEYVSQLNRELLEVRGEMERYGLVTTWEL